MWEKIVLNLISNAFKFTRKGKIEVTIRERKKNIQLRVKDSGIGISSDNINRIFERFERVEGVNARTYEGAGIGLALVKELVAFHGGSIKVNSTPGKGSEFIVSVPKGKSHLPPAQVYESQKKLNDDVLTDAFKSEMIGWIAGSSGKEMNQGRKATRIKSVGKSTGPVVLLADDNADMRKYLENILSHEYKIFSAASGLEAIELMENGVSPDLILSDVMMPGADGHYFAKWVRNQDEYANVPLILISARSEEADRITGVQSGADDYLTKPFSENELRMLIRTRIKKSRVRRQLEEALQRKNRELHEHLSSHQSLVASQEYDLQSMRDQLGNFAFIANHDLSEPLRKIQLYVNVLMETELSSLSERGVQNCNRILQSAKRMSSLLSDIQAFSRLGESGMNEISEFNLAEIMEELMDDLKDVIVESDAILRVGEMPFFTGNKVHISLLLRNLIINAIKFQPMGNTPDVRISASFVRRDDLTVRHPLVADTYLKLEVSDNGIGFDKQYSEKIFYMFQRLHNRSEYPGTGMGLAISKRIVENHGGFIEAEGKLGIGSTFSCYFPVAAPAQQK